MREGKVGRWGFEWMLSSYSSSVIVIDLDRLQRGFTMTPIGIMMAFLLQGITNGSI